MKRLLPNQILAFITHGKTESSYNNSKFKISAPTWNDKIELPHGSYSTSDILHQIFRIVLNTFLKSMEKILIIHQQRYM